MLIKPHAAAGCCRRCRAAEGEQAQHEYSVALCRTELPLHPPSPITTSQLAPSLGSTRMPAAVSPSATGSDGSVPHVPAATACGDGWVGA